MSKKPPLPPKPTAPSVPPLLSLPSDLVEQIEQLAKATTAAQTKTDVSARWEHTFKFVHASAEEEPTIGRLHSTAGFLEPDGWELIAVVPHEMRTGAGMMRGWMIFWKRRKQ